MREWSPSIHPDFLNSRPCSTRRSESAGLVSIDDVGVATAFLAHDAARLITGETLYVDGDYHIMD